MTSTFPRARSANRVCSPALDGSSPAIERSSFRWGRWRRFSRCGFFSSRRRHTRLQGDWSSDGALPISHDLAIISDEVFSDYGFEDDPGRVRSLNEAEDVLTFSLSGLSKVSGLPQLKLGWIVVSGPESLRKQAFDRLELIADTYLSVGAPVQWAAASLLGSREEIQGQILARARGNLALLRNKIGADSPWQVLDVEGGWYAVLQAPRIHTEEDWVLTLLDRDNVLVQPGFFYDFEKEAFLVLSLLTPSEIFGEGAQRIWGRG